MADFTGTIELRDGTDMWGPFEFDFTDLLPASGLSITSCDVAAYLGNVKPTSVLDDETDITDDIIESGQTDIVDDVKVQLRLQWAEALKGNKATLIFSVTLSNSAKNPFYFQYVLIK